MTPKSSTTIIVTSAELEAVVRAYIATNYPALSTAIASQTFSFSNSTQGNYQITFSN